MTTPSLPDALRACIELTTEALKHTDDPCHESWTVAENANLRFMQEHGPALEALLRERDLSAMAAETEAERGDRLMAERDELRKIAERARRALAWGAERHQELAIEYDAIEQALAGPKP